MPFPPNFLPSIRQTPGFDEESFIAVHESGEQVTSIRINPAKFGNYKDSSFFRNNSTSPVPWSQYGFYLDKRPSFTFDPLFHAGCYYVQEASSMFLEQAFLQLIDLNSKLRVLDLSASPGGKSTHIQSLISNESLLVSNEVIRQRAQTLRDNITRWGSSNVVVTCNDPRDFSKLNEFFDVIVVDAPCSGSGLFRRDRSAMDEWSPGNVALCCERQQRILSDVLPAIRPGGLLIYSTCSFSKEEDEDILDWMHHEFEMQSLPIELGDWGITKSVSSSGGESYRFWPGKVKGEGFYLACLRKPGEADTAQTLRTKPPIATKKEMEIVKRWVNLDGMRIISKENTMYCWPEVLAQEMSFILDKLRVIYSGVKAGEIMRDKLIPDHALALSTIVSSEIPSIELNYNNAIRYLQRKEILASPSEKGWQLVKYEGHSLGWVNVLPNRINNYYPKELRILKEL